MFLPNECWYYKNICRNTFKDFTYIYLLVDFTGFVFETLKIGHMYDVYLLLYFYLLNHYFFKNYEMIGRLKAYVSQEILNWHSLRHSHSAEF